MWELEKAILVTNNDRVYEKYKDQMKVILLDGYEDVLIKVGILSMISMCF